MGEYVELIDQIRKDKNQFCKPIDKFEPLIKKYTKMLYKDDEEDVRAEYLLALWEAVQKMEYNKNDAEVIKYLKHAVELRFFELYRKSREQHDKVSDRDVEEKLQNLIYEEKEYHKVIFQKDMADLIDTFSGMKKKIFMMIMIENMSDLEIASKLNMSRQYIHRLRRKLYGELKHLISQ